MTTIDKWWRVIEPVALFLGINLVVQSVLAWYFVGNSIYESNGSLSMSTDIMQDHTVLTMFITMLITIPVMMTFFKKDEDRHGFRTYREYYREVSFRHFWILIPLGIFMCLGFSKLVTIIPVASLIESYEEVLESYGQSSIWFRFVVLCILVPIEEELVYRGMLYKRLKDYNDSTIAAYIAAIVFGVVHMNLIQGVYAFLCGVVLIFVYEKYRTIIAPMVLHMTVNTMALISGEFDIFDKINDAFIAKLFFMILELVGVIAMIRLIWAKKKDLT